MNILVDNPYLFEYFSFVVILLLIFGLTFVFRGMEGLRKWTGTGLIAAPIIYFYLILWAYTLNIPFTDDYNLLETVYKFRYEPDFIGRIKVLFEQVNQHRFAFERIVMLLMWLFTGTVNIQTQVIIGDLFLLGILYLLFLCFRRAQVSWYCFIPVPYALFNLVYFENAIWGIAAIQNTPLIFFSLLSAYGLSVNSRRGWYLGLIAALVTTFTSGSGMLAWIIGSMVLFLQKRYKLLVIWILIAALVVLFYFLFDYHFIASPGGAKVWDYPFYNLVFLLGFWGNALYLDITHPLVPKFYPDMVWCVVFGAGIGLVFLIWTVRLFIKREIKWPDWFLWGSMMFAMGTGAMFIISRPINNYLMYGGTVFSRRYMIFGIVLLSVCYVSVVLLLKNFSRVRTAAASAAIAGFVLLNFSSYYLSLDTIRKFREDLVLDGFFWKNHNMFLTAGDKFGDVPFWNHPTRMRNLVSTLENAGLSNLYQYNSFPDHQHVLARTATGATFTGTFSIDTTYVNGELNRPEKFFTFNAESSSGRPAYFVLASGKRTLLLPAIPVPNPVADFVKDQTYYGNEVSYSLFRKKLPAGEFEIWLMYPSAAQSGQWKSFFTGKKLLLTDNR